MLKWTLSRVLMGGGLVVATCSLVACSTSSPRPAAGDLQNGLNLLDIRDPSWGMNAAYVKGNRVVFMETRVGAPIPEVYRNDAPDGPQNEMDMRFVDQDNHTFYVMRGGDSLADSSWDAEIAASRHLKPELYANREVDFQIAKEAAGAFAIKAPPGFADHAFHIARFAAEPTPAQRPELQQRAQQIAQRPPTVQDAVRNHLAADPNGAVSDPVSKAAGASNGGDSAYGYNGYGNWSILETDKYSGSTGCFAWICAASHSATRMYDYEGYYTAGQYAGNWVVIGWTFQVDANNHGRHATDSGMGYDCYSQGGWFWNAWITGATASGADGNGDGQGGCQTAYSWNTGGYNHLCNDDAAYELWQAKTGGQGTNVWNSTLQGGKGDWAQNGTAGGNLSFAYYGNGHCDGSACGSSPAYFACNCQEFGGCSGDWNTPICP